MVTVLQGAPSGDAWWSQPDALKQLGSRIISGNTRPPCPRLRIVNSVAEGEALAPRPPMKCQHCLLALQRAGKAHLVKDSLSIIFPVRNAEATLAGQVHELLDILPDLTSRFEILVIDDGSSDHTPDVAAELGRRYPQLRFLRSCEPLGHESAIKLGVSRAMGQTLLIQEGHGRLSPTDLRRLWSLRHDRGLVMAHAQQPGLLSPELVERLCTWGQTLRNLARQKQKAGIQMIRRDGAESLGRDSSLAATRSPARR